MDTSQKLGALRRPFFCLNARHLRRPQAFGNVRQNCSKRRDRSNRRERDMAGKGRQPGFIMGAEHRTKISNSKILKRLISHAEGNEPDMTASEVNAAISLLDRVMPRLKPVDEAGSADQTVVLKVQIGG